ncbi:MAG: response regulator [Thermodesulfobacteriota bacterium]
MTVKSAEILLVEDDPGDIELIKESLILSKIRIDLKIVNDGVKAMSYLKKEDDYRSVEEPDLIILDLNLPMKTGMEVLEEVKSSNELKHIPIIIMTTSDQDIDILKAYKLGANSYVTKPLGIEKFTHIVNCIEDFWLTIVKLPKRASWKQ